MDYPKSISVKTQVRRLKYLIYLMESIPKKGISQELLYNHLKLNNNFRKEVYSSKVSDSGKLKFNSISPTSSFRNYLNALRSLGLINYEKVATIPTNNGLILKSLIEKEFNLLTEDLDYHIKVFLLSKILNHDFYRFDCVTRLLIDYPNKQLSFLLNLFQEYYIDYLSNKLKNSNEKEKQSISDMLLKIKQWRSPVRYCEDIIPPRLNWGFDLGLFVRNDGKWKAKRNLDLIESISFNETCSLIGDSNFLYWKNVRKEIKFLNVGKYLRISNKIFSSLNFPRIPFSDSIDLVIFHLLKHNNIVAEKREIEDFIIKNEYIGNFKYQIRKSAREFESYIYIKKWVIKD